MSVIEPGAEPWHLLKSVLTEHGPALILHPSGVCAAPCVGPRPCVTGQLFVTKPVTVPLGTFQIRARFLPMGGVTMDIVPRDTPPAEGEPRT